MTIATGIGYDVHPFVEGRPLIIGGVEIPYTHGLQGHSDADVLTHAIIDALLGAAALGDIGEHFPDSDARYRDADSIGLLRATAALLHQRGCVTLHIDATVMIEQPKLLEFKAPMRERLSGALTLPVTAVSVKATRGEGLGFIGRLEGAAALAIATVQREKPAA